MLWRLPSLPNRDAFLASTAQYGGHYAARRCRARYRPAYFVGSLESS
jgi:hypothetical protein